MHERHVWWWQRDLGYKKSVSRKRTRRTVVYIGDMLLLIDGRSVHAGQRNRTQSIYCYFKNVFFNVGGGPASEPCESLPLRLQRNVRFRIISNYRQFQAKNCHYSIIFVATKHQTIHGTLQRKRYDVSCINLKQRRPLLIACLYRVFIYFFSFYFSSVRCTFTDLKLFLRKCNFTENVFFLIKYFRH